MRAAIKVNSFNFIFRFFSFFFFFQVKQELDAGREADRVATQFSGSPAHLLSIRTWQAICMACAKMADHAGDLEEICSTTLLLLDGFHLPSLTVYLENFLVTLCKRFPRFVEPVVLATLSRLYLRSAHTKTVQGAAIVLALQLQNSVLVQKLVLAMLPYLNAAQHPVRSRAVFACVEWNKNPATMAVLDEGSVACIRTVSTYFANCTDLSRKVVKSEDDWLLRFVCRKPSLKLLIFDIPTKGGDFVMCVFFFFFFFFFFLCYVYDFFSFQSSRDYFGIVYA